MYIELCHNNLWALNSPCPPKPRRGTCQLWPQRSSWWSCACTGRWLCQSACPRTPWGQRGRCTQEPVSQTCPLLAAPQSHLQHSSQKKHSGTVRQNKKDVQRYVSRHTMRRHYRMSSSVDNLRKCISLVWRVKKKAFNFVWCQSPLLLVNDEGTLPLCHPIHHSEGAERHHPFNYTLSLCTHRLPLYQSPTPICCHRAQLTHPSTAISRAAGSWRPSIMAAACGCRC